jgi:hypothetical protein
MRVHLLRRLEVLDFRIMRSLISEDTQSISPLSEGGVYKPSRLQFVQDLD